MTLSTLTSQEVSGESRKENGGHSALLKEINTNKLRMRLEITVARYVVVQIVHNASTFDDS